MNDPPKPVASDLPPSIPAASAETDEFLGKESSTPSPVKVKNEDADDLRFLSPPQAKDELGRLGGYRVLRVLGQGGMGMVLEAEDLGLNRHIALKVMRPEVAHRLANRQRFMREAKAAAAIEHINIVPIYQVGEENGVPFIAMPFLKGEPLDKRLKRSRLELLETLNIGWQTAVGLAIAHAHGLIHRDIKPGNIWLEELANEFGESGSKNRTAIRVRILDFGLARQADDDNKITRSGALVGTPAYMSPEQLAGASADANADLFSLGVMLYEMTTGRFPFKGKNFSTIVISLTNDTPIKPNKLNSNLPQALSRLIMQLLEKDPARRPSSAKRVAETLRRLLDEGLATLPEARSLVPKNTDPHAKKSAATSGETAPTDKKKHESTKRSSGSRKSKTARKQVFTGLPLLTIGCGIALIVLLLGLAVFRPAPPAGPSTLEIFAVDDETNSKYSSSSGLKITDDATGKFIKKYSTERKFKLDPGNYHAEIEGANGLLLKTEQLADDRPGQKSLAFKLDGGTYIRLKIVRANPKLESKSTNDK